MKLARLFWFLTIVLVAPHPRVACAESFLETFRKDTPIRPNDELRSAWVVRFTLNSRENIDAALDYAVRARFHLLFVQVRGRADAYYRSTLEPIAGTLQQSIDEFDPFAYFLQRAHEEGIAVHAWVNVYYVWSNGAAAPPAEHIVKRHPEWLVADRHGVRMDEQPVQVWLDRGLEGYFMSPGIPEARRYVVAVIQQIVDTYPVDGVHLDYVRYPSARFDFSEDQRTRFTLEYGLDPLLLVDDRAGLAERYGAGTVEFLDSVRVEWRSAQVDSLVRAVRSTIGSVALSAAVIPEFERARIEKGQHWMRWVRDDIVDFVVPMAYNYEPEELGRRIRAIKRWIGPGRFLVGLPVFGGRSQYLGYSVSLLRREKIIGYALFSYNALAEERFSLEFLEKVFLQPRELGPGRGQ